jgi:predicted unusual protein kinase regulating ubiquinone biosynthesis (AarF/ABC1/UbiB family)
MSAITEIGHAKMRMLSKMQGKSSPQPDAPRSAPAADEPPANRWALRTRAIKALWFGAKMVLGFIWWEMILTKFIGQERVDANRMDRFIQLARNFRALAVDLGGVWIKLGQFLSSRVDLLPPQIVEELAGLQDAVPAAPPDVMLPVIERELHKPINDLFEEFDPQPVAAASFGQAYLATLRTGNEEWRMANGNPTSPIPHSTLPIRVVVKVQRPNMNAIVGTDLRSLKIIAGWLKLYKPIRRRANLDALVKEFSDVVFEELDYLHEAQNAEDFNKNFAGDTGVRVPKVYHEFTTRRVIVLKNVEDIKVTDFEGLESAGISRAEVASKLFDTYLQQVFVHGFFHADPHPGNLFVQPLDPALAKAWRVKVKAGTPFRLTYVDFGMMGRIPSAFVHELREFIISIALKDARRWTASAQRMGFFLPEADLPRVEQAIGMLFDRFWGVAVNDISDVDFDEMYAFANEFRDILSELPFQIPQNVLYLGRAANILVGMMTALDPSFNPWKAIQPFAQDIAGAGTVRATAGNVLNEGVRLLRQTVQLPNQQEAFYSRALNGQMEVRAQLDPASKSDLKSIEAGVSRLTWALVFAALLICGTVLAINALGLLSAALFIGALVTLVRVLTV